MMSKIPAFLTPVPLVGLQPRTQLPSLRSDTCGTTRKAVPPAQLCLPEPAAAPSPPSPPTPSTTTTTSFKTALLTHIRPFDQGRAILENPAAQDHTEALIRQLEALNPTPAPARSPLLGGRWRLVYTTSRGVLGAGRPSFLVPRHALQDIDLDHGRVENTEVFEWLAGSFRWFNSVEGVVDAVSPSRLNVRFTRFLLAGLIPIESPRRFGAWLDITYLEDDLRIARGNKGNVFVLVRDRDEDSSKTSKTPTDH